MLTSQSHNTNPISKTGAKKRKHDFDDSFDENDNNDNNKNQSMNQNTKRKRSYLPSLPSPSPSPSQSSPPKKKKPKNGSDFCAKVSKKFPSESFTVIPSSSPLVESDLCTAIIDLLVYYARYRPTYDQSFTGFGITTRINKFWDSDEVGDGKIYLKPVQRFEIGEEEIRLVVRKAREILRDEEWEAVQRV